MGLTNAQQAILMFLGMFLPPLGTWMGLGFPTTPAALGILASSLVSAVIFYIKEIPGGGEAPVTVTP